jgi:ssDNA-binding Zn-finger/Zn-ribbon topoisomerase 1
MVIKEGRFGRFLACTQYPEHKETRPLPEELPKDAPEEQCSHGVPMQLRTGRYGPFYASTHECGETKPFARRVGVQCPKDGGEILEKRSKKGRTFYGCANYPACDWVSWYRPVPEACPQCGGLQVDMGRGRLRSESDFPSGGDDGRGSLEAAGREFRFQFVQVGNPQCSIEVGDELADLDVVRYGPPIESHDLFPNRTNVSFWRRDADDEITARIFERGVGETMSSGTGATGAAVASVLRGGDSPVTVHLDGGDLEVEVGEDLHVELTGWAVPVFAGSLSDELVEELNETE